MAKPKMVGPNRYRCWAKLPGGKRCMTFVDSYGARCKDHRFNW